MLEQLFHGVQISSRWEALWHGVKFRVLEYPIGEIFVKTRSCKDFCPFLGQLLEKIFICKINDISIIESFSNWIRRICLVQCLSFILGWSDCGV